MTNFCKILVDLFVDQISASQRYFLVVKNSFFLYLFDDKSGPCQQPKGQNSSAYCWWCVCSAVVLNYRTVAKCFHCWVVPFSLCLKILMLNILFLKQNPSAPSIKLNHATWVVNFKSGWNPEVWPFSWKLLSSAVLQNWLQSKLSKRALL